MARVRGIGAARVPQALARRRRLWSGVLVLALIAAGTLLTAMPRLISQAAPHYAATTVGVSDTQMSAAVKAAAWPQQGNNWCGIATVAAIANYLGNHVSQSAVTNYLNSAAAHSEWTPPYPAWNGIGPGVKANISNDSGTDPRALAAGMRQFGGQPYSQMVDHYGAWDATGQLAADLEHSHQPISVIVFNGQHSVVVSKITANGDPAWNPGAITSIEVWDPGYGTNAGLLWAQKVTVSLNTWLYSGDFWGGVYNDRLDPDPSVGPYTYDPAKGNYKHLWTGYYVYIRPGGLSGVNVDWAVDQSWRVIPGQHGELPAGYTPPPTPTPLPTATPRGQPTRVARLAPTALPTPLPTATATAEPQPTATATPAPPLALPAQSLCIGTACLQLAITPWWIFGAAGLPLLLALVVLVVLLARWRTRRRTKSGPPQAEAREPVAADARSDSHT